MAHLWGLFYRRGSRGSGRSVHMLCTHSTARLPPALYVQVCACICTCGCRAYLYVRVPADMHTQCCVYTCTRVCACGYACPLARVHAAVCRHAGVPLHVCVGAWVRVHASAWRGSLEWRLRELGFLWPLFVFSQASCFSRSLPCRLLPCRLLPGLARFT